jgi:UDP-glucose 4-epimerase
MGQERRVVLTGALGVNGVWVLRALREQGVAVLATDVAPDFALAPELAGDVEFRPLDVRDLDQVRAAVGEFAPTVVIHLAAMLPAQAQADPHRGIAVNLMGTANVLQASREAGVRRVVFTSSKAAYGTVGGVNAHPTYAPLREDAKTDPVAVYDHAKLASEGVGTNFARTGGPEFVALRFASIYGPGKLVRHGPMSLLSRIIEDAYFGRPTRVERGAEQRDDYLYVKDVATATVAAALHEGPLGHHVYNIGTGRGVALEDVAQAVRDAVPGADIAVGPGLDPMGFGVSYYSVLDCTRARRDLGFEAQFDLQAGIADYLGLLDGVSRSDHVLGTGV